MASESEMHPYVDWAKERLDEIDATLASFESSVAKMQTEARAKAEKAVTDIRGTRDAFRKSLAEHAQASETAFDQLKASLETRWTAFEADVQTFLDAAGKQAKEQEATFQARAEAQRKAWQESMDKLREAAASFTADRRAYIETALKQMKTEADAAKVKFDTLNKASGESWAAMNSALTETRAAMDRANQAVYDAFKRAS